MRLLLAILAIGLGCADRESGSDAGRAASTQPPGTGELGSAVTSRSGRHRVSVRPAGAPVDLGVIHDWIVRIERADGSAATPSLVAFDGGMPEHGHGFVTAPRVTRALGDGEFLVEGVKFHMAGAWELRVALMGSEGADEASIAISVAP